jgi:hypothetical protein
MIEPDPDWYGTYARRSSLADYLELLAIAGRSWSMEQLADHILDNRWIDQLGERIGVPAEVETDDGDLSGELDRALERAVDVVSVIDERASTAGDRYPFQRNDSGRLTYQGGDDGPGPYVRLLALTVGHAIRHPFDAPVHQVFEVVVEHAFSNFGFLTAGIGAISRTGGGFHNTLTTACTAVGLDAYPAAALARSFANDEGSDIISNVWSMDRRKGGLQLIGQATCARSNDWDAKILEPSVHQWRDWLGGVRSPVAYLAVPHHVEDITRAWLMAKRDRDVVDRLRLCSMMSAELVAGEAEIVEHVLGQALAD